MLDHVVHERVDALRSVAPQHRDRLVRQVRLAQQPGAKRVVDVVVDVGDAVDHAHDAPLERGRLGSTARVAQDAFTYLLGEVQSDAVALERVHHPQRVLVVAKVAPEALFQAGVEHLLADVPKGRMAEIVAQPDRLDEVLVQP